MDDWKTAAVWGLVPDHLRQPLEKFIDEGVRPGEFLEAFLTNDLFGTLANADFASRRRLADIANFIDSFVPGVCYGSKKTFDDWIEIGGMAGFAAARQQEAA